RYGQFTNRTLISDLMSVRGGDVAELSRIILDGHGPTSPAAAAIRIHNALDSGFLGLGGIREEVVYQVLDRPDLSEAERQAFLREVRAEYARRYGNGQPDALRQALSRS